MNRSQRIQRHGNDPIAYSTLQRDLHYFDTPFGYVAYRNAYGMNVTLGSPVCAPRDRSAVLEAFLARVKRPLVCYIREDVVRDLDGARLYCAGMGVDREADVDGLLATPPRPVSGAVKQSQKAGFQLVPLSLDETEPDRLTHLQAISRRYLANAKCNTEMSFLNCPMSYHDDGMRRIFALNAMDAGHPSTFGYATLNPVYSNSAVQGYLLDILRFEPTHLWGVWYSTVWHLARLLNAERKRLWLGFCPLIGARSAPAHSSRWMDTQVRWLARYCGSVHYIQRLHAMKAEIPGWYEPRYFASRSRVVPWALAALIGACGVRPSTLFRGELMRSIATGLTARQRGAAT